MSFDDAAAKAKALPSSMEDAEKLQLYGLYKQATVGDVNTSQPWAVQLEARAKWDAWNAHKGKSQEDAKNEYIALVAKLAAKYSA